MIIANEKVKGTAVTELRDDNGKSITICSSSVESEYLSPRQLLQGAIAGCMSMTLRGELRRNGIEYEDAAVTVEMEQNDDGTCFLLGIEVISDGDAEIIERCKEKAAESCFIKEILSGNISFRRVEGISGFGNNGRCCGL